MSTMPLARRLVGKQCAGKPHFLWLCQTEAWTGDHKPVESMLRRVSIRFHDAFHAPIRGAKRPYSPGLLFIIQRLDERTDRHSFIIAMQQIEINEICLQSLQTFFEICLNCL